MASLASNEYPDALFAFTKGEVKPTELTRGPWSHGVMHGGPICGLLAWILEKKLNREDLVCTRLTVEILSGVPVENLSPSSEVIKSGKQTAVVEACISRQGKLLARATSQWLTRPEKVVPHKGEVPDIPAVRADPGSHPDIEYPRPGFNADAVDLRILSGSTEEPGPGHIWARLDHPLVAGESPSPFQQIATLSDLGAAVGWENTENGQPLINTDVTLQLLREPQNEWVLFESNVQRVTNNLACCKTTLTDQAGLLGWVLQSQIVAPSNIQF